MKNLENELTSCLGFLLGRFLAIPIAVVLLSTVVSVAENFARMLAAITLWTDEICRAVIDSATWGAMWTLVVAQLLIGLLIGFALGLRAPKARAN